MADARIRTHHDDEPTDDGIDAALDALRARLQHLEELLGMLGRRLEPILRDAGPVAADIADSDRPEFDPRSPVRRGVDVITGSVADLAGRVEVLVKRVDL